MKSYELSQILSNFTTTVTTQLSRKIKFFRIDKIMEYKKLPSFFQQGLLIQPSSQQNGREEEKYRHI